MQCPGCNLTLRVPERSNQKAEVVQTENSHSPQPATGSDSRSQQAVSPVQQAASQNTPPVLLSKSAKLQDKKLESKPSNRLQSKKKISVLIGIAAIFVGVTVGVGLLVVLTFRSPVASSSSDQEATSSTDSQKDKSRIQTDAQQSGQNQNSQAEKSPSSNRTSNTANETSETNKTSERSKSPGTNGSSSTNRSTGTASSHTRVRRGLKYPAPVEGVGEAIGLQFFPDSITHLVCLNFERMSTSQSRRKNHKALETTFSTLESALGVNRKDFQFVTRGWLEFDGMETRWNHSPGLYVVKTSKEISKDSAGQSNSELTTIAGQTLYKLNELYFGVIDSNTAVFGNRNEVLFALRFGSDQSPAQRFLWIDFREYDAVDISTTYRNQREVLQTASAAQDSKYFYWMVLPSTRMAESAVEFEKSREDFLMGKISAREFEKIASKLSGRLPSFNSARRKEDVQKLEALAKEGGEAYRKMRESFDQKIYSKDQLFVKEQEYRAKNESIGASIASVITWPSYKEAANNSRDVEGFLKTFNEFESYQFENSRERYALEKEMIREFLSNIGAFSEFDSRHRQSLEYCLSHSSSRVVRQQFLRMLCKCPAPDTIQILGNEAKYFDLHKGLYVSDRHADDLPPGGEDEFIPELRTERFQTPRFSFDGKVPDIFLTVCEYYLRHPADPEMVEAICLIAEDLRLGQLQKPIRRISEDDRQPAALREIARRVTQTVRATQQEEIENYFHTPENADQALEWARGTNCFHRSGAITWSLENELATESRDEFLKALLLMLDDSLLCNDAINALKKHLSIEDSKLLQEIIKSAADPQQSNYRQRQDYSLVRIIQLIGHINDTEGLELAASKLHSDHRRYAVKLLEKNYSASQYLDDLFAESNTDEIVRIVRKLEDVPVLEEVDKSRVREWIKQNVGSNDTELDINELPERTIWRLLERCDPYRKEMVPAMIKLWSVEGFSWHGPAPDYLAKYGSSIEPMVIDAIEARNRGDRRLQFATVSLLIQKVGTTKCIDTLESYLDAERELERKHVENVIDTITTTNREPVDFETFPEPD